MASGYSTFNLPDGAKLAYEILGAYHLAMRTTPIVLVCGMSSVRIDYERLAASLVKTRPVLLYDHRGMGDSMLVPTEDEDLTIELLARDLVALLTYLEWKEVAVVGYSMGGVIAQQMLLLRHHPHTPTTLPFRVTHLFLAGTRSVVVRTAGLPVAPPPPSGIRITEEKITTVRRVLGSLVDPTWIEANGPRFDVLFRRAINPTIKRSPMLIAKQGAALQKFDFVNLIHKLPQDIQIMVIHGHLDQVIPFHCGEEILNYIPQARLVETGTVPGQVPSLDFGHFWYEYFDIQVWHDVINNFMNGYNSCET
ncbi:hypothetical protein HYPSUDRAFT_35623 [Hypholoma sublateritium FD-334 SS-4]|uniref:AB hydrolase-1 domain-containing protein n=1 Tax=Hypholoma sublateritium (strain FD-334 SS-4) TaxID=945553 RepID=A0A0D2PER8_HYPSF|nr:hypothetical protein HYPSUDRAFT_35623 [Hypholoma sublateritium FD-334 SS-4]